MFMTFHVSDIDQHAASYDAKFKAFSFALEYTIVTPSKYKKIAWWFVSGRTRVNSRFKSKKLW